VFVTAEDSMPSQRITTCLWFEGARADEAARFYVSVFPGGSIVESSPVSTTFELFGQRFVALNDSRGRAFSEASSLLVECDDQTEIDRYWKALTDNGGAESRCGWLRDRYGLSWQIVPTQLRTLLRHPKAMQAMLAMTKLDLARLQQAARET
jgi:predicted 3-demethylubiquinone-9 3-methyltransferase (glyoxalase superfamily)